MGAPAKDKRFEQYSFTEYPSTIQELDALAELEGSSRAVLIRRAIRQMLADEQAKADREWTVFDAKRAAHTPA
jgi:predicted transcriptional regulator